MATTIVVGSVQTIMTVLHKCGHHRSLAYGSRRAAEADQVRMVSQDCWECRNREIVRQNEEKSRKK